MLLLYKSNLNQSCYGICWHRAETSFDLPKTSRTQRSLTSHWGKYPDVISQGLLASFKKVKLTVTSRAHSSAEAMSEWFNDAGLPDKHPHGCWVKPNQVRSEVLCSSLFGGVIGDRCT